MSTEQIRLKLAEVECLMNEQEKNTERKMRELVRERDSLKKEVGVVGEKLGNSERKCGELDMDITVKEERMESLCKKILEAEENLEWKDIQCEELKQENIHFDRVVKELRAANMESEKDVQLYKSRVHDLEVKMSKVKANLAGLLDSMNDSAASDMNLRDDFVENEELVMLDPPRGLSNKAGASNKAPIARRCDLGIIEQIKKNLEKNTLKLFENSCFGHFLKVNKLQYQGPLIMHMVQNMDMSASNKERLVFNINNSSIEFRPTEFSLMTGLRFYTFEAATPSSSPIHSNVFQGRERILLKDIKDAFLATSSKHEGKGELTLKLALLYFLYGVLLGRSRRINRIELQYLYLIEDKESFNSFPWGRVAYDFLVSSMLSVGDRMHGSDQVTRGRTPLDIHGFTFAVQAWAYEVMPHVAAYCASRANDLTPQILRWSATKRVCFSNLSKFFPPTHSKKSVKQEEPSSMPLQNKTSLSFSLKRNVTRCGEEKRRKKLHNAAAEDSDDESLSDR